MKELKTNKAMWGIPERLYLWKTEEERECDRDRGKDQRYTNHNKYSSPEGNTENYKLVMGKPFKV